jgi:hypothetical protein
MPSVRIWQFRTGDLVSSAKTQARRARVGRELSRTGPTRISDATRIQDATRIRNRAAVEIGQREPRPPPQAQHEIFPESESNISYNLWF